MYCDYVSHVLRKCALKMATGQVTFHFLLCNCLEMAPFLPLGRKYDQVTTSKIAIGQSSGHVQATAKPQ